MPYCSRLAIACSRQALRTGTGIAVRERFTLLVVVGGEEQVGVGIGAGGLVLPGAGGDERERRRHRATFVQRERFGERFAYQRSDRVRAFE
jgi:hypothetical protein